MLNSQGIDKQPVTGASCRNLLSRIMAMSLPGYWKTLRRALHNAADLHATIEKQMLLLGKQLAEKNKERKQLDSLQDVEFKVFSQWGDDGIIQWLANQLNIPQKTFVEFGVEDYRESNTRFLMMNDNWSGLVMDSSSKNIRKIVNSECFWKYDLTVKTAFIDAENINSLLQEAGFIGEIGLLSIDIDGNDYWVWHAVNVIKPVVAIIEYNSLWGQERAITVPYERSFRRTVAHSSNLYYGASLRALCELSKQKDYAFIGCNSAGNNAYFVKKNHLTDVIKSLEPSDGFVCSKFRESRDNRGDLSFLTKQEREKVLKGMPVYNILTNQLEDF